MQLLKNYINSLINKHTNMEFISINIQLINDRNSFKNQFKIITISSLFHVKHNQIRVSILN